LTNFYGAHKTIELNYCGKIVNARICQSYFTCFYILNKVAILQHDYLFIEIGAYLTEMPEK